MNWKAKGKCNGEPPQVFYLQDATKAKSICNGCSVAETCAIYAINHNEQGVWGGYTEEERQFLFRASVVRAVPLIELLRRNKHEQERPANVSPSHPFYKPDLRTRSREAFERVAALPPLIFGKVCTAS